MESKVSGARCQVPGPKTWHLTPETFSILCVLCGLGAFAGAIFVQRIGNGLVQRHGAPLRPCSLKRFRAQRGAHGRNGLLILGLCKRR